MLTLNYIIEKGYELDQVLTLDDKNAIRKENYANKDANFSYITLMNEMFMYRDITVESLLRGWGGVKIFSYEYR